MKPTEHSRDIGSGDELLDHEYDGIREYDNPLPGWWTAIFIGSCVFSLLYLVHYEWGGLGLSTVEAYEEEMAIVAAKRAEEALALGEVTPEILETVMTDSAGMAEAAQLFVTHCGVCHGNRGEGKIGPNLTDDHWLHGAELMDFYGAVSKGFTDKGMPAWERSLRRDEVLRLAAYVGTLRGTHAPGGKAPEGKPAGEGEPAGETEPDPEPGPEGG